MIVAKMTADVANMMSTGNVNPWNKSSLYNRKQDTAKHLRSSKYGAYHLQKELAQIMK